ncbi:EF-hand domain-containing protein [Novosphingobium sp.]|uniref:EF-hand domain-containing protein n=1 Tax=Novosphingobium sp. TaxID=1874826 RepID=UPI002B49EDE6|nr:EF-hand domain-containing protein [Novosphingobium sp.]HKR92997.1 EF-hand domain-containing protein [Novosphingobium sp.]
MKTAMKKLALGLSAAMLSMGSAAYAQHEMSDKSMMDPDGDGVLTRAEAQKKAEEMFARLDVNKDGKLDQTDREAHRAEMRSHMFDKLDTNHDGSISKSEFLADRGPDADAEGPRGPGAKGHGMRGMHGGGHRMAMMMEKMADANHDGVITQAEFTAAAMKHFDMIDANHDGQVTQEERQAARQKMMSRWKAGEPDEN